MSLQHFILATLAFFCFSLSFVGFSGENVFILMKLALGKIPLGQNRSGLCQGTARTGDSFPLFQACDSDPAVLQLPWVL